MRPRVSLLAGLQPAEPSAARRVRRAFRYPWPLPRRCPRCRAQRRGAPRGARPRTPAPPRGIRRGRRPPSRRGRSPARPRRDRRRLPERCPSSARCTAARQRPRVPRVTGGASAGRTCAHRGQRGAYGSGGRRPPAWRRHGACDGIAARKGRTGPAGKRGCMPRGGLARPGARRRRSPGRGGRIGAEARRRRGRAKSPQRLPAHHSSAWLLPDGVRRRSEVSAPRRAGGGDDTEHAAMLAGRKGRASGSAGGPTTRSRGDETEVESVVASAKLSRRRGRCGRERCGRGADGEDGPNRHDAAPVWRSLPGLLGSRHVMRHLRSHASTSATCRRVSSPDRPRGRRTPPTPRRATSTPRPQTRPEARGLSGSASGLHAQP